MSDALGWLDKTNFWKEFSSRIGDTLKNSLSIDKEGKPKHVPFHQRNNKDKWTLEIFQKIQILSYHLYDLRIIKNSTKLDGIDEFLKRNNVESYYFLKYTYENHQIRIVSTLDICSKLGNTVFQLGIKERYCNWLQFSNKLGNAHFSSKVLLEFAKELDQNRGERNSIVHSGDYVNEILDWYDTYSIDEGYLRDNLLIESFKKNRDIQSAKLDAKMLKDTEKCYEYSEQFINSLLIAFKS
ncbi:Cthe_2314 family HEPN domain-containing protein [Ekhidna sp.]|uniref:Cthe_2314 family HEPN domain-containing protein n=1 Tax=Ekhidna sp. TaxID=2608089 RepID=UPI003CCBFACF